MAITLMAARSNRPVVEAKARGEFEFAEELAQAYHAYSVARESGNSAAEWGKLNALIARNDAAEAARAQRRTDAVQRELDAEENETRYAGWGGWQMPNFTDETT